MLALLLLVLAAAAASPTAGAAGAVAKNCGVVHAGGKSWQVTAAGLSCRSAIAVVRILAAKPFPATGHYAGTYRGMGCLGGRLKGRSGIECGGRSGQLVVAFVA